MKNISFLMIIVTFYTYQSHQVISQPITRDKGLWIEVCKEQSQNPVVNYFLDFETIRNCPMDTVLTEAKNEKTKRTWLGANLCNLLIKMLNISCEKIHNLSISASDGYTSVLSGELLSSLTTAICAYRLQDQEQWNENYGYMRLIFPELRGMYWVNSPEKMVITIGEKLNLSHQYQFYFIENERFNKLIKSDLRRNPYLVIDDILVELNLSRNNFSVLTSDGLFRQYPANEINRYFLLEKQVADSWQINGINLSSGLKTKKICFLSSGNKGVFLKTLNSQEQNIWKRLFWQHLVGDTFSSQDLAIELVFNNGQRSLSNLTDLFIEGKITIFELFEKEWSRHPDIAYLNISW